MNVPDLLNLLLSIADSSVSAPIFVVGLILLVLLHEPANRNAVRLLRALKGHRGK